MSIHLKPTGAESIVCEVRVYEHDNAQIAYGLRSKYIAVCTAIVCPISQTITVEALHGELSKKHAIDIVEALYDRYRYTRIEWERPDGTLHNSERIGKRKWKIERTEVDK